jgi:hypothetical protein
MVFRAFLAHRHRRPKRGRAHLGSLLLHLAALSGLALPARELRPPEPRTAPRMLPLPVSLARLTPGATREAQILAPRTGRKRPPRMRQSPTSRRRPPSETLVAMAAPSLASETDLGEPDSDRGALDPGGAGDESGEGQGGGLARGRRPELFARVIGGGIPTGAHGDRRYVSLREATSLRTRDYFPRLPAALWTERGPYVVVIELCVSVEGRVSRAALQSQASPRLDPLVLAAVRGWRYRPRLEEGQPSPFCHGVVIKYERIY